MDVNWRWSGLLELGLDHLQIMYVSYCLSIHVLAYIIQPFCDVSLTVQVIYRAFKKNWTMFY